MFQEDMLKGQTILITGGGSGLGLAMAERLGGLGARIGICGRRAEVLEAAKAKIEAAGGEAAWATCDVRDPAQVDKAVAELEAKIGNFDGLINNAAGNFLSPAEDLSYNAFNSVVQIVLYGSFNTTQALGRRWIERGAKKHHVLSIITTYAWMGSAFVLPSACAKAGVLAMARSLAIEWATYGIRFNTIAPGPFPTEGAFSRLMPPGVHQQMEQANPLGRFGEPHELADLAAYLFSPMATYINGETVTIDGGEWLRHGQEFSSFTDMPREQLKAIMAGMKPKKGQPG
jgi:NAD(P)-dependent dehydrogenase (short-subunit alcohol dehydrogenase family)